MNTLLKNPSALGTTLALLALVLLLAWQNVLAVETTTTLSRAIKERTEPAAKARELQSSVRRLLNEVINTSATNANARAVVQKYNIQRNTPPPADSTEEK